ncbi:hypothetical protein NS228_25895 [Methylobacterium indicum]|nr:hypothetical protein NS228_25895 [Methylobacterium indicum]KTS34151.1 hypothetical protein NS229_11620 [Methylobacterium indicum]KTS53182.1 hypothetical protein NS230_07165 [Methylobacterium indicum]
MTGELAGAGDREAVGGPRLLVESDPERGRVGLDQRSGDDGLAQRAAIAQQAGIVRRAAAQVERRAGVDGALGQVAQLLAPPWASVTDPVSTPLLVKVVSPESVRTVCPAAPSLVVRWPALVIWLTGLSSRSADPPGPPVPETPGTIVMMGSVVECEMIPVEPVP